MEGPIYLCEQREIVAVQVHGVGDRQVDLSFCNFLHGALCGHDDIDPVLFGVVLGYESVLLRVPLGVAEMIDGRVGEVELHH